MEEFHSNERNSSNPFFNPFNPDSNISYRKYIRIAPNAVISSISTVAMRIE